ncbi:MAG: glutamyl-tRNA reductase, partial [Halovenus sp.]
MTGSKIISGVSISHSLATIDQLEAAADGSQQEMADQLLAYPGVEESFVLKTCNRVEAYIVTADPVDGETALVELFGHLPADIVDDLDHEESLEHLLRVAAGLESQVLGEDQILGQIRDAYEEAQQAGALGSLLDDAVMKAIRVGERARTETAINEGVVSLASAAVRLASEKRGLDDATAVVVGAGEMGELAANRLAGRVDELILVNRTLTRAESVAEDIEESSDIETDEIDAVAETFTRGDVVISATGSSEWIVDPETLEAVGDTFVVDITRPRDIPPEADEFEHLT